MLLSLPEIEIQFLGRPGSSPVTRSTEIHRLPVTQFFIYLHAGLRSHHGNLSQDSLCPGRDSNRDVMKRSQKLHSSTNFASNETLVLGVYFHPLLNCIHTKSYFVFYISLVALYSMSLEERSIFWEVIISAILSKKVYMHMCLIPNGFRDTVI
jgi:hypothetical protein